MCHKLSLIWSWFVWLITFTVPDFPLSMRFRGWLYSFGMLSSGVNFQVASSCRLISIDTLSVGNNVYFAPNVIINGGGNIEISDEVMVGFGSVIVSGNHTMLSGSFRFGTRDLKLIKIGAGSWIGANCVVLAGSVFPAGSVLGAGSVLSSVHSQFGLYVGAPARFVRHVRD